MRMRVIWEVSREITKYTPHGVCFYMRMLTESGAKWASVWRVTHRQGWDEYKKTEFEYSPPKILFKSKYSLYIYIW